MEATNTERLGKMNSKQRVLMAVSHREPDRVPLHVWMDNEDTLKACVERYGSVDRFYDRVNSDICRCRAGGLQLGKDKYTLQELDALSFPDVDRQLVSRIEEEVSKHGSEKVIFGIVPGVLESACTLMGFESTLMTLGLDEEGVGGLFDRLSDWLVKLAGMAIDAGADVLFITDDWGENSRLLMSPDTWWEIIYPVLLPKS